MANSGKIVLQTEALDFLEYHGNKRMVKRWVEGLGDNWIKSFNSIPFGGLELYGQKISPCYLVRVAKDSYICETKKIFREKYYQVIL